VEPVAGFPAGTKSHWAAKEQSELADFLRAARSTKARFLLTSRRDERAWLHDLPARVELPPLAFEDRVRMTEEPANKHGRRLEDIEEWRTLLRFTQGNPLTLTVLVGQALRDGLRTRRQIEGFVDRLRAGEANFKDEASEGRTRSLAASLACGFENAFTETERKRLALLHLFQGFVDADALRTMGNPDGDRCLHEVRGLTREAGIALLDRAAEIGLLTPLGGGYYTIHPALPWFFGQLFQQYYAAMRTAATRAFVGAAHGLGDDYHSQYVEGMNIQDEDRTGLASWEKSFRILLTRNLTCLPLGAKERGLWSRSTASSWRSNPAASTKQRSFRAWPSSGPERRRDQFLLSTMRDGPVPIKTLFDRWVLRCTYWP
jgi:hypothetical protein